MKSFARGYGVFAPILLFFSSLIFSKLFHHFIQLDRFSLYHFWGIAIGAFLAGVLCWYIGKYLHREDNVIRYDKITGRRFRLVNQHIFLFIKFEHWFFVALIISMLIMLSGYWIP